MRHLGLVLVALTLFVQSSGLCGEAQTPAPTSAQTDHIGSANPGGTLRDEVRYLVGHWPRDFEIAVVEALGEPTCNLPTKANCWVRVKPLDVVLGHRHERSYVVSYRPAKETNGLIRFEVKQGDKMIAMLTPMIRPPNASAAYIATYMDHANNALVESVRDAVAESLMAGASCETKP